MKESHDSDNNNNLSTSMGSDDNNNNDMNPHTQQPSLSLETIEPSPAQRLNLSRTRTELAYLTLIFGASASGVIGPLLVPGFGIIAEDFSIGLTKVTLLNGSLVMALGISAYVCNSLSTIIGTRFIYLITTLSLVVTCCWGAAATSYPSLLAARIFQGLGFGSWFSVAGTTSLTSMFAVHERGRRVGIWNFAVICSINLAPVISAQVIVALSWRWAFWLMAILFGCVLAMSLIALPETPLAVSAMNAITPTSEACQEEKEEGETQGKRAHCAVEMVKPDVRSGEIHAYTPRWKTVLGLEHIGHVTPQSLMKALTSAISLLIHPVVLWGCVMWSVVFSWAIIQGSVADQIWAAPPFNLSPTEVGKLVGFAPLIGSALGCILGGMACDISAQWMTKRHSGKYEPESRLLPILPTAIALTIGIFGLGEAIERGCTAMVTAVFLAILNFGVGVGCTSIVAYTNDACQDRAGEVFGLAMIVKSAFAFGLSFMLNDYYANHGPRVFFGTFGGLTVGVLALTLPMYFAGKKARVWAAARGLAHGA